MKYNPNIKYDHQQYTAAAGVLPVGTIVTFEDGEKGSVVQHTNTSNHLISRRAPKESGASETRDWFDLANFDCDVSANPE